MVANVEKKMDREYLKKQYHQAILELKTAYNEDAQWQAREQMARIERTSIELFGEEFVNEIRKENGLESY